MEIYDRPGFEKMEIIILEAQRKRSRSGEIPVAIQAVENLSHARGDSMPI